MPSQSPWKGSSSRPPGPSLSSSRRTPEPATFLWLKDDDDGDWWPALVLDEPPLELVEFLGEALDCCVRLFHMPDGADIIPIDSRDAERVASLRWELKDVDPRFRVTQVATAVQRAEAEWLSLQQSARPSASAAPRRASPLPTAAAAAAAGAAVPRAQCTETKAEVEEAFEDIPYSEEEVIKMTRLLDALDGSTAAAIRHQLQASLRLPKQVPPRQRQPPPPQPGQTAHRTLIGTSNGTASAKNQPRPVSTGDCPSTSSSSQGRRHTAIEPAAAPTSQPLLRSGGEPSAPLAATSSSTPQSNDLVRIRSVTITEEPIFEPAAIDVLRLEVFENSDKFVLDPIYRYVETLGAVSVSSHSIECVLPTRKFLYENAHRERDRVLLCALGPDYDHTQGWFEPLSLDDGDPIQVSITVNGNKVAIPANWRIPTGKLSTARRTLIPIDITDVIECTLPEEEGFSLRVVFSDVVPQMVLWEAILVAVLVEQLDVTVVCDAIRGQYTSSRAATAAATAASAPGRRARAGDPDGLEVARQEISPCCPLTSVQMLTPCRSVACEHLQCLELTSVVSHCIRTHVWNCPLCHASALPKELAVDYPLMELLSRATRDDITGSTIAVDPRGSHVAGGGYTLLRKRRRTEAQHTPLSVDDD